MSDPHDHEHYRVWFHRVGRGIALVGPSLILLIILATFVTRLFEEPEEPGPPSAATEAPIPNGEDLPTTPATSSSIQVAPAGVAEPEN